MSAKKDPLDALDGPLFDQLREWFGVGDELTEEEPTYRWRNRQVAKLRAMRRKRELHPDDIRAAAEWCRTHGQPIKAIWELFPHIPAALEARKAAQAAQEHSDIEEQISDAIAIEAAAPDSPWLDRLIRAAGPAREEVFREWQQWSPHSRLSKKEGSSNA